MDKASDFGSEDCRFESCHSRFWIYNKVYFEIEIFQADHICIVLLKRLFTVTLGLSVLNLQESLFWNLPYLHCASKTFFHCISRESNPGQLLGRQLCSPLYHWRCFSLKQKKFQSSQLNKLKTLFSVCSKISVSNQFFSIVSGTKSF